MENLKPFSEYKDSGQPWLGEIPLHWASVRIKHVLNERSEKGYPNEPLLAATQTKGVVRKDQYENRTVLALKDLHFLKLVRKDDFVISLRSFQGGIEYARQQGIISPAYTVLSPKDKKNHLYLSWLFKSKPFIENLTLHVTGIRQGQNIDYSKLRCSQIPIPPPEEQSAIVRFLDHANRRIRRYIRAKRKLIELLNEQKQALIHQAVTRGLDPHVKLKPSGVEWLGDVPEHWDIRRNGFLFKERVESGEANLPLLTVSLRTGVTIGSETDEDGKPRRLIVDRENYKTARKGDLAYNMMRLWQGAIGVVPEDGLVSPAYVVASPIVELDARYFELLFRTEEYMQEVNRSSRGIVSDRNRCYWDNFKQLASPVPPPNEQTIICNQLVESLSHIDKAKRQAEIESDLIQEYLTRLIADVVTGKLDVREAAEQLDEPVIPETNRRKSSKLPNKHFYRSVLAAEIVDRHQKTKRFGHIKLQKALVLAEYHLKLTEIQSDLKRAAAGPFDNAMMRSIDMQLKKQKWFEATKSDDAGFQYKPLEKHGGHRTYFDRYWSNKQVEFDRLVALIKPMKTIQAEIVATLYSAWNDLLIDGEQFDDERLVSEVLTNWHPKKERITSDRWHQAIQWMRDKQLVPTGFGVHTQQSTKRVKK